jgi:hypothetical protein
MRGRPVLIWNRAGAWLFVSVQHEWTKAILSTWRARLGKISGTQVPDLPCWAHLKGDFMSGPTSAGKKPVLLSKPSSVWPSRFIRPGL